MIVAGATSTVSQPISTLSLLSPGHKLWTTLTSPATQPANY